MADETVAAHNGASASSRETEASTVDQIQVNADALTLDDLVFLEDMGEGKVTSMRAIRDFFNRVVVGGAGKRKISELQAISKAIVDKVGESSNPKEAA
jgi:hypothetical protein